MNGMGWWLKEKGLSIGLQSIKPSFVRNRTPTILHLERIHGYTCFCDVLQRCLPAFFE